METRQERAGDGEKAAAQYRVEELRGELKRKQQELDELLMRSETLHPSAYGALQGSWKEKLNSCRRNSIA